ncbi:MAG TPA: FHA domain-containing protein [Phycisphaerae bacterium]|nr:FHA domain-containing protein [Phycisphaerae bacterium]
MHREVSGIGLPPRFRIAVGFHEKEGGCSKGMALLVCCPCGNPLDCERLDLIVAAECPKCQRDLQIELVDPQRGRYRALITVMEGSFWVGEQFVLPVGQDLIVGTAGGCWLSLESDVVAKKHCRLKVTARGSVQVEDLDSESGTWIGPVRISTGKLKPGESFTVGEYRLRLDLQAVLGGELISSPEAARDTSGMLPDLKAVEGARSVVDKLVANRFEVARQFILFFAWVNAVHHAVALHAPPHRWEWYWSFIAGACVLTPILLSGKRVALAHRYLKYAAVGVLAAAGVADLAAWNLAYPASAAFVLAAGLPLLMVEEASFPKALLGLLAGVFSIAFLAVLSLQELAELIPA